MGLWNPSQTKVILSTIRTMIMTIDNRPHYVDQTQQRVAVTVLEDEVRFAHFDPSYSCIHYIYIYTYI